MRIRVTFGRNGEIYTVESFDSVLPEHKEKVALLMAARGADGIALLEVVGRCRTHVSGKGVWLNLLNWNPYKGDMPDWFS